MISIPNLKKVALAETISWTLLVISVILDRAFDWHSGISIMGPIHGILFIALAAIAIGLTINLKWPISRLIKLFLASLMPLYGYVLIGHEADAAT